MLPQLTLIAAAALGIDVGWEPLDDGGVVYIIQIEPDQLERLENYDDLLSDMPKDLDVRQVKITIGTDKLPRSTEKRTTAKPAGKARELIAEGSIPAPKSKPDESLTSDDDDGPQLIDPSSSTEPEEPAVADSGESAEATLAETTTLRPIDDGDPSRDPEPRDEEESELAPARVENPVRRARDELFETPPSRPLSSRLLEDPEDVRPARTTAEASRFASEPDEDYEAAKPTLPSSFRTADNSARLTSASDDRESGNDAAWGPVVAIFFFLLLSMGANMWLAWIAWEARQRYQVLLEKYRAVGGKPAMELV